ncbi:hypothetical protein BH10PSE11_BH10PSE11_29700 [soil metagenome]
MKRTAFTAPERDYSGLFLGAILLGIVIVVLGLALP